MNKTVAQVAKHYIKGPEISEGALNRVEAAVRSFDPCLSCSTHAFGAMPMHVQMIRPNGEIAFETKRG
jgi:NAD-reducing hydrogenase large subunit